MCEKHLTVKLQWNKDWGKIYGRHWKELDTEV